mmetsp:Transcript_46530/g.101088  ORF Transcript_46530/g.101088 Transcript_46530/m.101088 type:complete len:492 (+) Transcript_46530:248-1723(+)
MNVKWELPEGLKFLEKGHQLKYEHDLGKESVTVYTRAEILHVWDINVKNGSFSIELRINAKWKCPAKHLDKVKEDGGDDLDVDWLPDWLPQFSVINTTDRIFDWPSRFNAYKEQNGEIWIKGVYRFAVSLYERFNLRSFPFDLQYLNVRLEIHNGGKISCENKENEPAVFLAGVESPEFSLPSHIRPGALNCVFGVHPSQRSPTSELHIVIFLERQEEFYFWNGMFLLLLIVAVSIAVWAVHWREVANRIALDLTLLLVATTFKQLLSQETARVAYLTILDKYAILCVVLLFIATWLHAIVGFLIVDCETLSGDCYFEDGLDFETSDAYNLDTATLVIFCALIFGTNAYFIYYVLQKRKENRQYVKRAKVLKQGYLIARFIPDLEPWYKRIKDADADGETGESGSKAVSLTLRTVGRASADDQVAATLTAIGTDETNASEAHSNDKAEAAGDEGKAISKVESQGDGESPIPKGEEVAQETTKEPPKPERDT